MTLYDVSSFFLSNDVAGCVATFSIAYDTGVTLDNSQGGSDFVWYVPGDSGFYVETTDNNNEQSDDADNGNGGPFSLVVTLTNAGVSLT